jgi:peptidoglycan-N-acetylglucosamine deacetylase
MRGVELIKRFDRIKRVVWIVIGTTLALAGLTVTVLAHAESPQDALLRRISDKALRMGDRGPEVAELQQMLLRAGADPGRIDGIFGPLTEAALRQAQTWIGVEADGLAGRNTVTALEQAPAKAATTDRTVAPPAASSSRVVAMMADRAQAPSATLVVLQADAVPALAQSTPVTPATPAAETEPFALTFNGAPDPAVLPQVLQALQRHDMKATFFVTGRAAADQPELLRAIAAAGHEVASNGQEETDIRRLSPAELGAQVRQASRAIAAATGQAPAWFRPPLGLFNQTVRAAAEEAGMQWALWTNVGAPDRPELSPAELVTRLTGAVHPGSVLLLHQDRPATVAALDGLLASLKAQGYRSVTLSDLGGF